MNIIMWIIGIVWYGLLGLAGVITLYEIGAMFKLWPSRLQPDPIPAPLPTQQSEELSA